MNPKLRKKMAIGASVLLVSSSLSSSITVNAQEVISEEVNDQSSISEEKSTTRIAEHVQPNINWNENWQNYNGMPSTIFYQGSFSGAGKFMNYQLAFQNSAEVGDTIPAINLKDIQIAFSGQQSTLNSVDNLTVRNVTQRKQIVVPGDQISIFNGPPRIVVPVNDENVNQSDIIELGGQTNWSGSIVLSAPKPEFTFQKAETMLTRVYYLDASTGETIAETPYETLGSGLKTGDSVSATAKDFTEQGYDYSGVNTVTSPNNTIDGTGNTATTVLQRGDWDNTNTTTGRQAIIFWYNQQDKTAVNVHDSTIYSGMNGNPTNWSPEDNFDNAMNSSGTSLTYEEFIAQGGTVDDSGFDQYNPGVYEVNYTLNGVTSTATITVLKNQYNVTGISLDRYVGDALPEDNEFEPVGTDIDGSSLPVTVDKSEVNMNVVGSYPVTLTVHSSNGTTLYQTVYVNVKANQTAVNVHDSTIYVGDDWKAEDNFDSALDKDGNPVDFADVTVDDSQVDPSKAGTYEVTYTYDGVTSTATITVKDKQTAVNVHDSTIYVGDDWKAEDNFDSALDKDGKSVGFADITVDDSQVDPSKAGMYKATYTYDGVTSTATITVKDKQTAVNVHDSTIYVGDDWKAEDNFDSALDKDGKPVDFSQITVDDSKVDTSTPGTYEVTYTYDGVTSTATITVKDKQTAVNVHDSTIYVGDDWKAEDNFDSALDKDGKSVGFADITVDDSQVDPSKAGMYKATYTYDGVTSTATITVKDKQTAVNVHDSTIYVGDDWKAEDNFDSALDKDGKPVDFSQITVDDSKVDTSTPGTYEVTYTYDGVTSTATITVKDKQTAVNVHDSTIYVGDDWKAEDNFDSALDKDGKPVDFSQITVDDSKVDTSTPGTYEVTYTYDGVTSTATITVKDKQTAVNVHDSTIYVGDDWKAEDNFDSALDKDGKPVDFSQITVDDSKVDTSTPGTYEVTYTYDGVTSTATITVKDKQTAVNVHDSTIYVGDDWKAEDNFDSALDKDGNTVDFSEITVDDSKVDTSTPGTFEVTYTYDGVISTATITVEDKQTAVNVHDSTIYVGDDWKAEDNFDSALDKDGKPVDFADITVNDSQVDPSKAGMYEVTYTYDGITSTATVTVKNRELPEKEKSIVVVQYVDENGNKISKDTVLKGEKGEHYKTEAKKIDGYALKKTPKNSEGQFSDKKVIVVYTYKKEEVDKKIDHSKPDTETSSHSSGKSQKEFPKTGEEQSNMGLLFGGSLLVLVAGVFFLRRKKNE